VSHTHRGPERLLRLVPSSARCARSRTNGWSRIFGPVTRCRKATMGVRGFIRICAPTGCESDAIAWLGSCGCKGLRSVRRRTWRPPAGALPAVVRANVLRREFTATRPNEKWTADITYVPTRQGWL
jgi:hypothetical protein